MAGRAIPTDRLFLMLGLAVLVLGALVTWAVVPDGRFGLEPPSAAERARGQLREYLGPTVEVRYTEAGSGRAVCGYAGRRGETASVAFISRPNRLLLADDPLPGEFNSMMRTVCPGFPINRSQTAR